MFFENQEPNQFCGLGVSRRRRSHAATPVGQATEWSREGAAHRADTSTSARSPGTSSVPSNIIISKDNGNTKYFDGIVFVNHGYHVEGTNNSRDCNPSGQPAGKAASWSSIHTSTTGLAGSKALRSRSMPEATYRLVRRPTRAVRGRGRVPTASLPTAVSLPAGVTTSQAGTYTVTFTAQSGNGQAVFHRKR